MSQIVAYNRRIPQRALLLAMAMLAVIAWMLALAPAAGAGEWVQRSCSVGTEYIFPEGWEGKANSGYSSLPNDNCEKFYSGGGLRVDAAPVEGHEPLAGQTWTYKPPHGSTIAGGTLTVYMTAREGLAQIAATVKSNFVSLAKCESPGCFHYLGDVPITAAGASEIYEQAACFPREGICHTPEGAFLKEGEGDFSAEAEISSAQVLLSTNATPAGSGLSGTLLNNTVTGKGTLSFTATDAGPGVYQARANIDGQRVWAATPNLNEGKCVSTGTSESARAFNYAQPCPAEAAVHTEIDTSGLTDGAHALTVEVEDAAGDTTTVYAGTLSTLNHLLSTPAPVRGPANGTPASESATLTAQWKGKSGKSASHLRGRYGHSHEITGKLTNTAGTPIAGALVEANQKPSSLGAIASSIASTHTATNGSFTISVPRTISSTSIQLAYRSHLGDATPAATHTLTLQVPASLHLMVSPHATSVGQRIVFTGVLHGAPIPPGGKQLVLEASSGGGWVQFDTIATNAKGRYRASYRFKFPGPVHYQFRVVCKHEADFPFLAGISNHVHVWER
jgi:hypothetical protein